MSVAQFAAVGSAKTYFAFKNSSGYAIGTGTSLANGATSGAGQLLGFKSINIPVPPARAIPVTGDNTILGSVLIPGNTVSAGTLVTSISNPTLSNKAIGLLTETVQGVDMDEFGTPCPVFTNLCIIDSAPGFSATTGLAGWETTLWFDVQIFPLYETTITADGEHTFTFNVKANPVTVRPNGTSSTVVTNGTSKALGMKFFTTYPMLISTFVGDGAATTFTLDQTPTTGVTSNTTDVLLWDNGSIKTQSAGAGNYTQTGGVVTFGTAPTAGHFNVAFYFYSPTC